MPYIALEDGSLEQVNLFDPNKPSVQEVIDLLQEAHPYATIESENIQSYYDFCYIKDQQDFRHIVIRNISFGCRPNRQDEFRIQVPHQLDRNYFLGLYQYQNQQAVLCAWKKFQPRQGTNRSLFLKIDLIQKVFQNKDNTNYIAIQKRNTGDFICAFLPESLPFYLENSDLIHDPLDHQTRFKKV